jgi:hypothetical protein
VSDAPGCPADRPAGRLPVEVKDAFKAALTPLLAASLGKAVADNLDQLPIRDQAELAVHVVLEHPASRAETAAALTALGVTPGAADLYGPTTNALAQTSLSRLAACVPCTHTYIQTVRD